MYVYVCMCMCVCTCVHLYMCMCVCVCVCLCEICSLSVYKLYQRQKQNIEFVEPNDIKKTETTEINKFLKLDTPSCKSFTLLNQAYVFPTSLEESVSKFQKFDGNKFFKKLQISFYLLILYKL